MSASKVSATAQFARAVFRRNPYWAHQRKPRDAAKFYKHKLAMAGGSTDGKGNPLPVKQSWNVVTGDLVQVTESSRKRDKEKGKWLKNSDGSYVAEDWLGAQGKVLAVLRKTNQIIVQGVNMKTRIAQPTQDATGHFYKMESPIPYSQVRLVDPTTNAPVSGLVKTGRVRVAADTGARIPRPRYALHLADLKDPALRRSKKVVNPQTDTLPEHVLTRTYRRPTIVAPQTRPADSTNNDPEALLTMPEDIELRVARIKF